MEKGKKKKKKKSSSDSTRNRGPGTREAGTTTSSRPRDDEARRWALARPRALAEKAGEKGRGRGRALRHHRVCAAAAGKPGRQFPRFHPERTHRWLFQHNILLRDRSQARQPLRDTPACCGRDSRHSARLTKATSPSLSANGDQERCRKWPPLGGARQPTDRPT